MDGLPASIAATRRREFAALCATEAIQILAASASDPDISDEELELRIFAEASIHHFISVVDEES
jgi:hypothetical protein